MSTISASIARQTLTAQLDKVASGEEVTITRHGKVVAVLISPESLRRRRNPEFWKGVDDIGELLEVARSAPLHEHAISAAEAEAAAQEVHRDRAGR